MQWLCQIPSLSNIVLNLIAVLGTLEAHLACELPLSSPWLARNLSQEMLVSSHKGVYPKCVKSQIMKNAGLCAPTCIHCRNETDQKVFPFCMPRQVSSTGREWETLAQLFLAFLLCVHFCPVDRSLNISGKVNRKPLTCYRP